MDSLLFSQIFPCDFTVGLQSEAKSYITMKFKYQKYKGGNDYKIGYILFKIFCHQSLIKTDYGKLRYDYLLEQLNRLINNSRGTSWLGRIQWDGMEDMVVDSEKKYIGVSVLYKNIEFI